jgi:hypothetical protein
MAIPNGPLSTFGLHFITYLPTGKPNFITSRVLLSYHRNPTALPTGVVNISTFNTFLVSLMLPMLPHSLAFTGVKESPTAFAAPTSHATSNLNASMEKYDLLSTALSEADHQHLI